MNISSDRQKTVGLTLVEIMIIVAIIALLAAIVVPPFFRAKQTSEERQKSQTSVPSVASSETNQVKASKNDSAGN